MSWKIEIKPATEKEYKRLDGKTRKRMKAALKKLEGNEGPLSNADVKPLTGPLRGDCRLRVGDWRVLFTPDKEAKILYVYAILPRGRAYK